MPIQTSVADFHLNVCGDGRLAGCLASIRRPSSRRCTLKVALPATGFAVMKSTVGAASALRRRSLHDDNHHDNAPS